MTKVSKNGQTRTAASLNRQEEMNLRPIARASPHDFERADRAGSDGGEDRADGADGPEEPPPQVPLAELQRRAGIMFSGDTGAVVASGSGPATTAATFELARDVRKVILGLPAVLFERSAKPRPCGLLCKLSAAGMLMCDVLGLPLTPFVLAEPIGKEAARLADKISAEVKKAKKAAAGKGMTPQEAEAAFLRRRIKLPLSSATEIAKAWRQSNKQAATKAMPPPPTPPTPLPTPDVSPQPPAPQPPAPQQPPQPPRLKILETGDAHATGAFMTELKSSILVGKAIVAAFHLEGHVPWATGSEGEGETDEEDSETDDEEDEAAELATVTYKHALRQLTKAYPEYAFAGVSSDSLAIAGEENSRVCACGNGRAGDWPWQLQPHTRGFCYCHLLLVKREEWLRESMGICFDRRWCESPHRAAEMVRKALYRARFAAASHV